MKQKTKKQNGYPNASPLFQWLFISFVFIQVFGLFVDGWAHGHILEQINTFFTPWHAFIYGGYLLATLTLLVTLFKNYRKGYPLRRALPKEYFLPLFGAGLFVLGGIGDLTWHTLFGIESGVDALLSPSHMALFISGCMMSIGPLRSIWYKEPGKAGPILLSFLLTFLLVTFMLQFVHPYFLPLWMSDIVGKEIPNELERTFHRELGIVDAIAYSGIFMGMLLSTIRHYKFRFGSLTLILGTSAASIALMFGEFYSPIAAAFAAGIMVDLVYFTLYDRLNEPKILRLFGFVIPSIIFASYLALVLVTNGTWWSIHLMGGYVVIAGMAGAALTYLLLPPGDANH